MGVIVNEAGQDELPLKINNLCAIADERTDFVGGAEGQDPPVPDGDGLRFASRAIHRPDLPVEQDEVRPDRLCEGGNHSEYHDDPHDAQAIHTPPPLSG